MPPPNPLLGTDRTTAIELIDSDDEDLAPPPPSATAAAGSSSQTGSRASLVVPRHTKATSHISIGSSSGGQGSRPASPDDDVPPRAEKRPKPSFSSSQRKAREQSGGAEGTGRRGKSKAGKERKGRTGSGYAAPEAERARSRSQVQRENNRRNVIEVFSDSDDDLPPPKAGPSTSFRTRPTPSESPVKPRISHSPVDAIPHAEAEADADDDDAEPHAEPSRGRYDTSSASLSPSLVFLPKNTGSTPTGSAKRRPMSASKGGQGQGRKRVSMADLAHISMSPDSPPPVTSGQGGSGLGLGMGLGMGMGMGGRAGDEAGPSTYGQRDGGRASSSSTPGPSRARQLEEDNRMDEDPELDDNGDAYSSPAPDHPSSSPMAKTRPNFVGAARRRIPSSSSPISPVSPAGPSRSQPTVARTGFTAPTFFPPSQAAQSPTTPDSAGPSRSSDPLDSIPRPGGHRLDPESDGDMVIDEFDFAIDPELDMELDDLAPTHELHDGEGGGMDMDSVHIPRPSDLSARQVEKAIVDATQGVDEVDIADEAPAKPAVLTQTGKHMKEIFAKMSRAEKIALIDSYGKSPEKRRLASRKNSHRSSAPDETSSVENVELTISDTWPIRPRAPSPSSTTNDGGLATSPGQMPDDVVDDADKPKVPPPEQPPLEYRGTVRRYFESHMNDDFNKLLPTLTPNPALRRQMFQDWMSKCSAGAEPHAKDIRVFNDVDGDISGAAPEMEYQYGNDMMYHPDVPDPDTGTGCGCVGPCNTTDQSCRCVRRQELYSYDTRLPGFAYNEDGTIKNLTVCVWECGPNCGCPPSCMNRVIQRGRSASTEIDLFKTKYKGWGMKARYAIPHGTFLGVYSGEVIPDYESERRGHLYNQIGRTYLFDCDGWQIRNPPPLDKLRVVDPRLADLAEYSVERFKAVMDREEETNRDWDNYSAYSVDAFHYGFTRYFNHSCDPNLGIVQAYVGDFHPERPKLVVFTRRAIAAGEEMCISYMGVPDDEDDGPVQPIIAPKNNKGGKKSGRRGKAKRSTAAHVAGKAKLGEVRSPCQCGSWNCKGAMFAL